MRTVCLAAQGWSGHADPSRKDGIDLMDREEAWRVVEGGGAGG